MATATAPLAQNEAIAADAAEDGAAAPIETAIEPTVERPAKAPRIAPLRPAPRAQSVSRQTAM
jgi:hypothetical protein